MENREMRWRTLLHGADYYPEQWLEHPDILKKDLEYMKKAKINVVSLGVFAWSMLEPEEGVYDFGWMEHTIDTLYQNNIAVMLATPSGARPKWMSDKYPEVLRVDENRVRHLFGERHNHCYTSPVYREKTAAVNRELSRRFGSHPAVIAWHISNEYGGECHCPLCQQAFREWLEKRYETIEQLNKAWETTFWSHRYQDFLQIESPSPMGESKLHGLNLDWKRFVTDRTVDFAKHEIESIRKEGSDLPTTINLMYDFNGLNYYKFKDVVDIISWDAYPVWHKEKETHTAMDTAMQHDFMRSILKKPFLLMESCPTATNWQSVSKLKKPGILLAASLQAIAHGSDSVQYFQLRQSRGASEKFHGAVIDHYGGADTRVFGEVSGVGEALEKLAQTAGSHTAAKAAVMYDRENRWAMEDSQGPRNKGLFYKETVLKSYGALRKAGLDVDVIDMEQSLEKYEIVAAPMLYMLRGGFEKKAEAFVKQGGTLIFTYWSGIVNDTDLCFLGGTPHGLLGVFGIRSMEIDGLYDGEENRAIPKKNVSLELSREYRCKNLCDLVKTEGAEVLAEYGDDFYAGMPALTVHAYGEGRAYYVCADFEEAFYQDLYQKIIRQQNITPLLLEIPEGVEVTSREDEKNRYLFIQNFNREAILVKLPEENAEILFGEYDGRVEAFGTVVLKMEK